MLHGIFSLRYLLLRRGNDRLLVWRDTPLLLGILVTYAGMAYSIDNVNFFGPDGFVDRVGSLTSTLTGFYVAALVAVAAFASSHADIDQEIKVGPVHQNRSVEGDVERDPLTRREYVCAIFGYVSLLALALSIFSIIVVTLAEAIQVPDSRDAVLFSLILLIKHFIAAVYVLAVAHLLISTSHGLYYLSYRLYIGDGQIVSGPWDSLRQKNEAEKVHPEYLDEG